MQVDQRFLLAKSILETGQKPAFFDQLTFLANDDCGQKFLILTKWPDLIDQKPVFCPVSELKVTAFYSFLAIKNTVDKIR